MKHIVEIITNNGDCCVRDVFDDKEKSLDYYREMMIIYNDFTKWTVIWSFEE